MPSTSFGQKPLQYSLIFLLCLIGGVWLFGSILTPFLVGLAVAYLLNPLVSMMQDRHIPRWISSLLILFLFFIGILIIGILAIPLLIREAVEFVKMLPDLFSAGQIWITNKVPGFEMPNKENIEDIANGSFLAEQSAAISASLKKIFAGLLQGGLAVLGTVSFLFLMPIVAFYLMVDWQKLKDGFYNVLPPKTAPTIKNILTDIDYSLAGFIRGQLLVCVVLGLFYAIALSAMGLHYGFLIGMVAGLLSIIPYVGSMIGLVSSVGMAFYQFDDYTMPGIALAIFVAGQLIEGNYLTPKFVGERVGLHPLWVIFALMAGGTLMGIVGMMIAVPIAAAIAVLIKHTLRYYKQEA